MPSFLVTVELTAPPDFVAAWWLDYGPKDVELSHDMERRTVERLDERRVRVVTDLLVGKRQVRVDGIVTRLSPRIWNMDSELFVNGRPFGKELIGFSVAPTATGSRLEARFRFVGRGPFATIALALVRGRLRRDREEAYRTYARELTDDHAREASVTPGASCPRPSGQS